MVLDLNQVLSYTIQGNTVMDYLTALAVFILTILVLRIFKPLIIKRLEILVLKTKTDVDDLLVEMVDVLSWPFYIFLGLIVAFFFIDSTPAISKALYYITIIIVTYYLVKGVGKLIDYFRKRAIARRRKEEKTEHVDTSAIDLLALILKIFLWAIAILLVLSNLGYNVSTLIAGLGIGGVAIAFALQNVLTDIFASFSIYLDKPFRVGDFIKIGEDSGTVLKIGIKSTRIKTLLGDELVVSNKELTEHRVHNYKRMKKRRITFEIGVTYDTPVNKLEKIPKIIAKIINKVKHADPDRIHFRSFDDFSLKYEIVYYLDNNDYAVYLDVQQKINLAMAREFKKEKIDFAYPTQTVFVSKNK